jgi:DNA-binding GntR family transcriptional regulator
LPTPSGDIEIPSRLTQTDLADFVGASRVRVNQVLVDYRERGLISVSPNHRFSVHDTKALALRCE